MMRVQGEAARALLVAGQVQMQASQPMQALPYLLAAHQHAARLEHRPLVQSQYSNFIAASPFLLCLFVCNSSLPARWLRFGCGLEAHLRQTFRSTCHHPEACHRL